MYIETSIPRMFGDKAWLLSPVLPPTSNELCLSFYYYMYGQDVGTLNVRIKSVGGSNVTLPVWSSSGERGDRWLWAQISINITSDFQVCYAFSHFSILRRVPTGDLCLVWTFPEPWKSVE